MKPAFDFAAVRRTLQHGIDRGYWSLEDLDRPPKQHLNPSAYRNLLRESPNLESVNISNPRDFTPAITTAGTPADSFRSGSPSVLLDTHRPLDATQHHESGQQQNPKGTGEDQRNERRPIGVGATGNDHSSFHGTVPDDW